MPVERLRWTPGATLDRVNADLRRFFDVTDASARVDTRAYNVTATVALTYPHTLLESTTTAGAVVLTFPLPHTVPGYRVDAVKVAGANALTVNGLVVATFAGWISTGAAWRRVA